MLLFLFACRPNHDIDPEPAQPDEVETVGDAYVATTDKDGAVEIPVEIGAGDVFQVVLKKKKGLVAFEHVRDPDGVVVLDWEDWWDSKRSLTDAILATEHASALNWPPREIDGPLAAGTWTVVGTTLNDNFEYAGDEDVDVELIRRAEPDRSAGTLRAVVAYARGVDEDDDVVDAVERAVDYWGRLYESIGVTLDVDYTQLDVDPNLPSAYSGQREIAALLEGLDEHSVLLVVGDSVEGDDTLYGEAAAVPGPFTPTSISVVEVGWLANAGGDGHFSDEDVLLFGETMAHEVGHFLGLYHPVEDGGYGAWEWWDALDDTEECTAMTDCEGGLGANLMFPYPICTRSSCARQDQISDDQAGVVNAYAGVE